MGYGVLEVTDLGLGREDPLPWEDRHKVHVEWASADRDRLKVERWDSERKRMRVCSVPASEAAPFLICSLAARDALAGFDDTYDEYGALATEKQLLTQGIADRLHSVWAFSRDGAGLQSFAAAETVPTQHIHRGFAIRVASDILTSSFHPVIFDSPSLAVDDDGIGMSVPIEPRHIDDVFQNMRSCIERFDGGDGSLSFASANGARFLSLDEGRSWLRFKLESPRQSEHETVMFLKMLLETHVKAVQAATQAIECGLNERADLLQTPIPQIDLRATRPALLG